MIFEKMLGKTTIFKPSLHHPSDNLNIKDISEAYFSTIA